MLMQRLLVMDAENAQLKQQLAELEKNKDE
jgi:hypothetical protein